MDTFSRGLDEEFVKALNHEYEKDGSWWKGFVDDTQLFIALRHNRVNVYYRGCSLLDLEWEKNKDIIGRVHYKYLLRPRLKNRNDDEYVNVRDGRVCFPVKIKDLFVENLTGIQALKQATEPYAKQEKIGVHHVVLSNCVLDVEIAFGGRSRKRIDFSVLQKAEKSVNIVFFEAKHFDSRELRARIEPKVIGQIGDYADLLRRNRKAIIDSYRRVCCNLWNLNGIDKRHPERHELLREVVDGSRQLRIDEEPRLAVFGFDEDQRVGKKWRYHREKLKSRLKSKVYFRGSVSRGWPSLLK